MSRAPARPGKAFRPIGKPRSRVFGARKYPGQRAVQPLPPAPAVLVIPSNRVFGMGCGPAPSPPWMPPSKRKGRP
jgi:hypothetical protein